ncbi:MAG: PEGA domain-containing protein, partial [Candidatus Cryptobacteroides sp.]
MKRRLFTLICGLVLSALCFAQLPMSIEKGIEYQPTDQEQKVYSQVKDMNDHLCALIKVSLTNPLPYPLSLEVGGLGVTKREEQESGEIWFFVPYQVKNLEFKCKGYTPIPKIPVTLKEGGVYTLTIRVDASEERIIIIKPTSGYMKIRLNPTDAFLSLGQTKDYELGYMSVANGLFAKTLNYGTWYYKVESELYKTHEGVLEFDSKTPILEVKLEPDYSYLNISTDPEGADVYVDNKYLGKSPVSSEQKFKNGKYSLKLIKEDYYSENNVLILKGNGDRQSFSYSLKPRFGEVECICDDPKAEIWIDEQYKGIGRWKGTIGSGIAHILESKRAGHRTQSIELSVADGERKQAQIAAPIPLYGYLNIETSPMECEVYVDGQKMGESPLQLELLACEHSIKLVKDDFMPIEDKIQLSHNQQFLYQHTFTEKKVIALPASNCFLVSQSGTYSFAPVKGNSNQSIGKVSSVEVLWETFGTDVKPNVGDLIQ